MINLRHEISNLHQNAELLRRYTFEILQAFNARDNEAVKAKFEMTQESYRVLRSTMLEIERKLSTDSDINF